MDVKPRGLPLVPDHALVPPTGAGGLVVGHRAYCEAINRHGSREICGRTRSQRIEKITQGGCLRLRLSRLRGRCASLAPQAAHPCAAPRCAPAFNTAAPCCRTRPNELPRVRIFLLTGQIEMGPKAPFLFDWRRGRSLRTFFAALSCFARKPGLGILPRPLRGKKVQWTFFYSASPLCSRDISASMHVRIPNPKGFEYLSHFAITQAGGINPRLG